ncbi:Gfo/Idh/MocA family oxidoreductase [Acholeplasma vituli]|uniref:Gfo/Idh/MocA family oxidoreductase n=1 Tax=Paracholeplasma vituli TaxID=69473 RepID=A0ABT2PWW2_9MOLU|nr:Gfo/Idh/MocA family oxidoreductase [Paracholeplasma vituli]MCU0104926.1 Gfo/Idh/MocA family oxidoreductase [Paracholeplasma vituli]
MIKFGLIGAGAIAHAFSKAAKESGIHLEAVGSRSLDKALEYQKQYGYQKAYGSYEALLQDPEVDAIYLATPHGLHYEQMLEILKYKKHILCEKAFTLNEAQAKHIFDEANKQGVYVMEAMWTRFLPLIYTLKKELSSGYLGAIKHMAVKFTFVGEKDPSNRLYNPNLGGGALLDIGIYPITYANIFLGVPESFEVNAQMTETGVDGTLDITYHYPNAKAHLEASFLSFYGDDAYFICELGSIHIPKFWGAHEAFIYDLNKKQIKHIQTPYAINGYEYEIRSFVKAIETKTYTNPYMTTKDTLEILSQMDAIRKRIGLIYPKEGLL